MCYSFTKTFYYVENKLAVPIEIIAITGEDLLYKFIPKFLNEKSSDINSFTDHTITIVDTKYNIYKNNGLSWEFNSDIFKDPNFNTSKFSEANFWNFIKAFVDIAIVSLTDWEYYFFEYKLEAIKEAQQYISENLDLLPYKVKQFDIEII